VKTHELGLIWGKGSKERKAMSAQGARRKAQGFDSDFEPGNEHGCDPGEHCWGAIVTLFSVPTQQIYYPMVQESRRSWHRSIVDSACISSYL
jgi:hypothetical protein